MPTPQPAQGAAHSPPTHAQPGGAGSPDAGPWGDALYAQCPPSDPAAPATQAPDGSWVLPPLRAARQACLLVTCDARRLQLEAAPAPLSTLSFVLAMVGLVMGLALGGVVGWQIARLLP